MARSSRGRRAVSRQLGLVDSETPRKLPSDRRIVGNLFTRTLRFFLRLVVTFFLGSIGLTALYRFIDPPLTPLMIIRPIEGLAEGRFVGLDKEWVSLDELDPDLVRSAIAGEDARFFDHGGIDWEAVEAAQKYNERHKGEKVRGASTITMQCARNVFLWQGRNYIRKGLEGYFTYLTEFLWGKERILEIYLNVIEWGDGVYGAEAAAQKYFGVSARDLTSRQAALLIAVLPNPRKWSPAKPTGYINRRASSISKGARVVSLDALDDEKKGKEKAGEKPAQRSRAK